MQSFNATSSTESSNETSAPAFQVSRQMDQGHDLYRAPNWEMETDKKNLVIEPTHPSNSGAYYCATTDVVAQLILKNQGDLFCKHSSISPMTKDLTYVCHACVYAELLAVIIFLENNTYKGNVH